MAWWWLASFIIVSEMARIQIQVWPGFFFQPHVTSKLCMRVQSDSQVWALCMKCSWTNEFFHSSSQGPGQDTFSGPYQLGRFDSKFRQKFKPGYFKVTFTRKLNIFTLYQILHQACSDWHGFFSSGSVDQSAVGIIEKGAHIYVKPWWHDGDWLYSSLREG